MRINAINKSLYINNCCTTKRVTANTKKDKNCNTSFNGKDGALGGLAVGILAGAALSAVTGGLGIFLPVVIGSTAIGHAKEDYDNAVEKDKKNKKEQ